MSKAGTLVLTGLVIASGLYVWLGRSLLIGQQAAVDQSLIVFDGGCLGADCDDPVRFTLTADATSHTSATETSCTDKVDNDADGAVDCADSDCTSDSACQAAAATPTPDGGGLPVSESIVPDESSPGVAEESGGAIEVLSEEVVEAIIPDVLEQIALPEEVADVAIRTVEVVDETLPTASTVVATAAVGSAVATTAVAASATGTGLLGYLQLLVPFLSIRKRQPPWGRVVEEGSNRPIKGAIVTIFDEYGKPRSTVKTRADGTFGVLLPQGKYRLVISHRDYEFSPRPEGVLLFPDERLYLGDELLTTSDESLVPVVVAVKKKPGVRGQTDDGWLGGVGQRLKVMQAKSASGILIVGAALNTIALIRTPTTLFLVLGGIYAVLLLFEILRMRVSQQALGMVLDAVKKTPVQLALVRLLDKVNNRIVGTAVTLPKGHFLLMPPPGNYRMQVIHKNYQLYTDDHVPVHKWASGAARIEARLQPKDEASPDF